MTTRIQFTAPSAGLKEAISVAVAALGRSCRENLRSIRVDLTSDTLRITATDAYVLATSAISVEIPDLVEPITLVLDADSANKLTKRLTATRMRKAPLADLAVLEGGLGVACDDVVGKVPLADIEHPVELGRLIDMAVNEPSGETSASVDLTISGLARITAALNADDVVTLETIHPKHRTPVLRLRRVSDTSTMTALIMPKVG